MGSRKRKFLRKFQAFLCLLTCVTLVGSDELRDLSSPRVDLKDGTPLKGTALENRNLLRASTETEIINRTFRQGIPYIEDVSQPSRGSRGIAVPISHEIPEAEDVHNHCPPSCFCEKEAGYASCVGDGQRAPPLNLPVGLTRIEYRGFLFPELGSAQLNVLPEILELKINQCNLSMLLDDTFTGQPELDGLDMSENLLASLGPHTLRGLKSLRHLDLSNNRLTVLKGPFSDLSSLQHLNLHHNLLRSLIQDTFQGLDRVQYIDLDSNEISFLEVSAFQHLTSLAHLILSNNQLSSLATLDFFGSRLQYIDVSNIGITRVPQALTQFVRDLRLARNDISEIHRGDLDSYPYLTLLVLDNNHLEILEEDALGRHEYLARLWLNGNDLLSIPLSLPPSLQALYLDENFITGIHQGDFLGLINLQQLSLQHNNISVIAECALCDLMSLKTLNLQGNQLTNLTGRIFSHLVNLENLDLSQNPLISLNGEALLGLTSVRVLQMSHILSEQIELSESLFDSLNGIWILELCESPGIVSALLNTTKMTHTLRGLKELNIMYNGLTSLRPDFPTIFPKLQTIKLSGNSWDCSSQKQIMWLKEWMERSSVNFFRSYSVRCATPLSLSYKPVILLEDADFTIPSTTTDSGDLTTAEKPIFDLMDLTTVEKTVEQLEFTSSTILSVPMNQSFTDTSTQNDSFESTDAYRISPSEESTVSEMSRVLVDSTISMSNLASDSRASTIPIVPRNLSVPTDPIDTLSSSISENTTTSARLVSSQDTTENLFQLDYVETNNTNNSTIPKEASPFNISSTASFDIKQNLPTETPFSGPEFNTPKTPSGEFHDKNFDSTYNVVNTTQKRLKDVIYIQYFNDNTTKKAEKQLKDTIEVPYSINNVTYKSSKQLQDIAQSSLSISNVTADASKLHKEIVLVPYGRKNVTFKSDKQLKDIVKLPYAISDDSSKSDKHLKDIFQVEYEALSNGDYTSNKSKSKFDNNQDTTEVFHSTLRLQIVDDMKEIRNEVPATTTHSPFTSIFPASMKQINKPSSLSVISSLNLKQTNKSMDNNFGNMNNITIMPMKTTRKIPYLISKILNLSTSTISPGPSSYSAATTVFKKLIATTPQIPIYATKSHPFSYHRVLLKDLPIETSNIEITSKHTKEPLQNHFRRQMSPVDSNEDSNMYAKSRVTASTMQIHTERPTKQSDQQDIISHRKDLWLYRGDSSHGGVKHGPPIPMGLGHGRISDEAVVGAGIVATCLGIALFIGGFLLAQSRAKAGNSWESSSFPSSTYWRGDGSGEEEVLMAVEEDDGSSSEGAILAPNGPGVETVSDNYMGLNNRLYLLLQRDSSTGITPENLPDPRAFAVTQ